MRNPHKLSVSQLINNASRDIHVHKFNRQLIIIDGIRSGNYTTPAAASFAVKKMRITRVLVQMGYKSAKDVLPSFSDRKSLKENVELNMKVFDMAKEQTEQTQLF